MRLSYCLIVFFALSSSGVSRALADESTLPLVRVMLSTGGVGYFEHEAVVSGDARLSLTVRLDQVDDVLKSIVVFDDKGGVGAINLPGRQPLSELFRDLPFGPEALGSPIALLNALRGATVRVAGARDLEGRILRAEPEIAILPNGAGSITRHRVTLVTSQGLRQFVLEDAESVRFVDDDLEDQIEQALAGLAANRRQDLRTFSVTLKGVGERRVRVGYVVEAPLWKASYRLVLPNTGDATEGYLQGWAVTENMSGADWNDVELTLVSGNPVTFRQALYTAYYVDRPEVPVEVLGRVLPMLDHGALRGRAMAADQDSKQLRKAEASRAVSAEMMFADMASAEMAMAPAMAAESQEAATQVLFRLPMPISVAAGHSVALPIVDRQIPARRLAHYQPTVHARNPLAAVRLVNDGPTGLPPGVLTIYERDAQSGAVSYVGDARLATLPAGDDRLVSFAVDEKTTIAMDNEAAQFIASSAISKGVLRLTLNERQTTTYRIKAPAREPRRLLLDHPRRPGWTLIEPAEKSVALTDKAYRIEVALDAGAEVAKVVTTERPILRQLGISNMSLGDFVRYASTKDFDAEVREAFERLAELRRDVDSARDRVAMLDRSRQRIWDEQTRIRDNLGRVPSDSDLYNRYLRKLHKQETELESIDVDDEAARDAQATAEERIADFIAELDV